MARWMRRSGFALAAAGISALLALQACTTTQAYRTEIQAADKCLPDAEGRLPPGTPAACQTAVVEIADSTVKNERYRYDLFFTEFDDQGWVTDAAGSKQLDYLLEELRRRLRGIQLPDSDCVNKAGDASKQAPDRPVTPHRVHLVVFVHGWKHNARHDDKNVASFRKLLREIAIAECGGAGTKRDVIGIYVGWRGGSLDLPEPLESLSFWDRKSTATDVAQGTSRELFARLDGLVDKANDAAKVAARKAADEQAGKEAVAKGVKDVAKYVAENAPKIAAKTTTKPVRMMMIGHSFGGHILLTGLGGSVLRNLATYDEKIAASPEKACDQREVSPERDADMIVLVNPAIEGSRFEPLHRVGRKWQDDCYHAPLFVSVTSNADRATKNAFPIGRWFSTFFETYSTKEEGYADGHTFGHDPRYLTHELTLGTAKNARETACERWNSEPESIICSIKAELSNQIAFQASVLPKWHPEEPRQFCAGALLTQLNKDAPWRAPILNIRTTGQLIEDHNKIFGSTFVSFLRELYMDTLVGDAMYGRVKVEALREGCGLERRVPAPKG